MSAPLPTHDEVARLLGLERWWIGPHHTSPQGDGGIWAEALWVVEAEPSFDEEWALAGVLSCSMGLRARS